MLENILTQPDIDNSRSSISSQRIITRPFTSNVKLSGEASKFKIMSGSSTDKIREVPFNSIDLAYIDGSGKGIVMLADLVSTWNLVKVNGLIICSRYSLNPFLRRALHLQPGDPGPHEAIDTFLKMYKTYITVVTLQGNYVIVPQNRE